MFTHFQYDDRLTLAAPSCANGAVDYISEFREDKIATIITVPRLLQVADLKPNKSHDKKTQNITNIFCFTKIKQKILWNPKILVIYSQISAFISNNKLIVN